MSLRSGNIALARDVVLEVHGSETFKCDGRYRAINVPDRAGSREVKHDWHLGVMVVEGTMLTPKMQFR